MPKMPKVSSKEVIRVLQKLGFEQIRQNGSHVIMQKGLGGITIGCVVPIHKELKVGTLSGILKQADITLEEFIKVF
jgi:predicted RNA binding protein YcfA (HicA-like mRNA interferase family)